MNQAPSAAAVARERVRTTERVESASGPLARKRFGARGWCIRLAERLGLRQPAARREFEMLGALRARGLPVPEPVAIELHRGPRGEDVVVSRWVEGARDLASLFDEGALDPRQRRLLARRLGELVRALHDAGVVHHDLHAGNVLVQPDGTLLLIDFHRARRSSRRSAQERDLADLAIHFLARTRATERLRFLRAALPVDRAAFRELGARSLARRRRFFAHHEQRARGSGRAFERLRLGSLHGVARREWAAPVVAALTAFGDDPWAFAERAGQRIHRGGDAEVFRVEHADLPFPLLIKRYDDRGPLRRLLRGSRAARAWLALFRLQMAQLPVPRPVLFVESPLLSLAPRSLLVTEYLGDHEMLHEHVGRCGTGGAWPTLRLLAADLARMHDEALSHRDLKAENLLVPRAGGRALCVDVDGLRRSGAPSPATAARDLMRLNASFRDLRTVSWRARGRFLAAYRRARLLFRPELRELWKSTGLLTEEKWRNATPR